MDTQLFNQSPNTPGNKKNGKGGMSTGAKAGLGAAAGVAVGAVGAVAANHIANKPAEDSNPEEENREQNPEEAQKTDGRAESIEICHAVSHDINGAGLANQF